MRDALVPVGQCRAQARFVAVALGAFVLLVGLREQFGGPRLSRFDERLRFCARRRQFGFALLAHRLQRRVDVDDPAEVGRAHDAVFDADARARIRAFELWMA